MNTPKNSNEQMQQIIEDTNELMNNVREISEILAERAIQKRKTMANLGWKIAHSLDKNEDISSNESAQG